MRLVNIYLQDKKNNSLNKYLNFITYIIILNLIFNFFILNLNEDKEISTLR